MVVLISVSIKHQLLETFRPPEFYVKNFKKENCGIMEIDN